ncbi:MAG: hypothetical protein H0W06_12555 [Chloroflexia bacterium]|nr:hypothetical protein [Chloroflexia bacterium]
MTDRSHTSSGRRTAGTGVPGVSGVIETIAAGLSLAIWRPRLLIVPVLLDLVLWLGFQMSAQSLTTPLGRVMTRQGGENGDLAAEQLARFGEQAHLNDLLAWFVPSLFAGVPRDTVLNGLLTFLAPSLMNGVDRERVFAEWGEGVFRIWRPDHWATVVGVAFVLLVVSSSLLAIFRVPLAQAVRGGRRGAARLLVDGAVSWLRIVGLILLVVLASVLVLGPVSIAAAVALMFGVNLTGLVALALVFGGGLVAIYTLFTVDAIVLGRVGPLHGLRLSYAVVRANFGPSMRFALTSMLIATGSFRLWQELVSTPPGIVVSLLGNAIVGTGLVLASMMFFYDRIRLLPRGEPQAGRDH